MQLTKKTDFSLRVLLFLAELPDGQLCQIKQLSDGFGIPMSHITKIVNQLAKVGLIYSRRGRNGGICLAYAPEEINLAEVVGFVEPNLDPIDCNAPPCILRNKCELKIILNGAVGAYLDYLGQYSLADIMGNTELIRIIED